MLSFENKLSSAVGISDEKSKTRKYDLGVMKKTRMEVLGNYEEVIIIIIHDDIFDFKLKNIFAKYI
jgi:hypothetical protein